MGKLVVYKSSTGFTKKYAMWIAEALNCEAKDIKKVSKEELNSTDTLIYGGWIMGSMIMGLDKIKNVYSGKLVVFAVGSTPTSEEVVSAIKKQNNLESTPLYYMEGGFEFEKLGFFKRNMLKMVKKSVEKKENKTEQDLFMIKALGTSFDHSDKKFIDPLVKVVNDN